MQRNALLSLTLGAILFVAHPAHAQFIGDRMRITTEDGEEFIGKMKSFDNSFLTILTDSTEQTIAYNDMARLQRSLGRRSYYRGGAMVGLGVGALGGIVGGVVGGDPDLAIFGTGIFGGVGGLTGMMVGATIRREKWDPVHIPDQDAAFVMPGIGVQPPGFSALEKRMRVTTANGKKIVGQMKGYDADSLTILTGFTEQSIAYADMVRLQRSLGIRSYYRDGARMGLTIGVGGSIALTAILRDPWAAVVGIGLFTPMTSLGGMTLGRLIMRERWERVAISDEGAASVMPDIPDQNSVSATPIVGVHPASRLDLETRVRITTKNGEKFTGRMKEHDAYSLTIFTDSTIQSIAYTDMARLQRSLGFHSHFIAGAIIGLGAGTLLGIRGAGNVEPRTESGVSESFWAITKILLGSGGGTLLGAIVGASIGREKWERLDISGQSAASVMPIIGVQPNGRLALGARISF